MTVNPGIGPTDGVLLEVEYIGGIFVEGRYTDVFRLVRRSGPDSGNETELRQGSGCRISGYRVVLKGSPVGT